MRALHDEITRLYYETTAARTHVPSRDYYERAAAGLRRWLSAWLPDSRDADCLDIACGCGEFVYFLEREGFTRTAGVDLCEAELRRGRSYVRGALVHADAIEYLRGRPSGSVDFMTALNFLEHLTKDALLAFLREARRVLRPRGALVAMVPNAVSPFGGLTRHWDMTHEWAFTANNFRQLAALTGFAPGVEFRECGPVPHGFRSAVRFLAWQGIRAAIAARLLVEIGTAKGGVYTMDMLVRMRVPGP